MWFSAGSTDETPGSFQPSFLFLLLLLFSIQFLVHLFLCLIIFSFGLWYIYIIYNQTEGEEKGEEGRKRKGRKEKKMLGVGCNESGGTEGEKKKEEESESGKNSWLTVSDFCWVLSERWEMLARSDNPRLPFSLSLSSVSFFFFFLPSFSSSLLFLSLLLSNSPSIPSISSSSILAPLFWERQAGLWAVIRNSSLSLSPLSGKRRNARNRIKRRKKERKRKKRRKIINLVSVLFLTFSGLEKKRRTAVSEEEYRERRREEEERRKEGRKVERKRNLEREEISPSFIPETLSAASSLSNSLLSSYIIRMQERKGGRWGKKDTERAEKIQNERKGGKKMKVQGSEKREERKEGSWRKTLFRKSKCKLGLEREREREMRWRGRETVKRKSRIFSPSGKLIRFEHYLLLIFYILFYHTKKKKKKERIREGKWERKRWKVNLMTEKRMLMEVMERERKRSEEWNEMDD